jgi:hypothetical protein
MRDPAGWGVRDELHPCNRRKQAVVMQFPDPGTVGLLECLQDLLVVLAALGWLACPVDESPYRGLPGLHIRIIAVPQNIHLRECPFGEGRP